MMWLNQFKKMDSAFGSFEEKVFGKFIRMDPETSSG